MKLRVRLLLPLVAALAWGGAAAAAPITVTLSQISSDSTPAGQLDASVTFTVTGSTLTVQIDNQTSAPATFSMTDVFFNASTDVTSLALTGQTGSVTDWALGGPLAADGFGTYDYVVSAGTPLPSGGTTTLTFTITGGGTIDETDFVGPGTFSVIPPGDISAQVAAKFAQCLGGSCVEDDDSAFGASNGPGFPPVPEPGTIVLLGLGLAGLAGVGRRR